MSRIVSVVFCGALVAMIAITSRAPPQKKQPPEQPAPKQPAKLVIPEPEPERRDTKTANGVFAQRGYERLLHNRRAAVMRVTWSHVQHEGRTVIRDVTLDRSRSARDMGGHIDIFEMSTRSDLLRTESGDLIRMYTEIQFAERVDSETITRTETGYKVVVTTGDNEESFEVPTGTPVQLDAESFLVQKIRSGEARAGSTYTLRLLSTGQKKVIESQLRVIGQDDEGPGLKVEQTTLGFKTLWWFAQDGAVVRNRRGDNVIRRADHLTLKDLPRRPAVYPITVPSDHDLPRLFTNRRMIVDVVVKTDDTIRPPQIPDNPFTEVIQEETSRVRLLLKEFDDPKANVPYPVRTDGMEEYLKPTPLMEVDHPTIRARAKRAVGDATDARTAATRIADEVFRLLAGLGSPSMAEPTAVQILENPAGDCSEHCLLFTTLCRAAGIPARRCSGYVCIGGDWGSHAWCEIWLGKWIGADPTTNEIGTRARYIFCARQDDPDMKRATIRAARTKILIRSAEYDDGKIDLEKGDYDRTVFTGIRFAKLPEGWRVNHSGAITTLRTPDFRIDAHFQPDQGYRALDMLGFHRGKRTTFGGRPALTRKFSNVRFWRVPTGRQILEIRVTGKSPTAKELAALLKPTLDRVD